MGQTNSSSNQVSSYEKLLYQLQLLSMLARRRKNVSFEWLETTYAEYNGYARQFIGRDLRDCKVLEIGFGARPFRFLSLAARGIDIFGVDLDAPFLEASAAELITIYRSNGLQRALKSLARWLLIQQRENAALVKLCSSISKGRWNSFSELQKTFRSRLMVADASDDDFWRAAATKFDFVFSEDVFEHIPPPSLDRLLALMAANLSDHGIILTRPNVFTGITGGHLIEWYAYRVSDQSSRRSEPWEHLRKNRFPADTYLNGLSLAAYRELFSKHFDIALERTMQADLGREHLTQSIREELNNYKDEELFSNNVLFVLKKKIAAERPLAQRR
ncbi:class I SAM-dependent methyltransferase [Bradyrhizobium sp. 183]|uniref:class I SAM-dependent methyltransferase n=1 Tax=unclassified Bradyrhizobium TaxID=2631580 RepID=UPI001FFE52C9|nr:MULTISPECIES: class I SAM-dependent methyltransferase [unclassified Bradyrhizobium]UPJ78938.1 class I SAM-dependent methyltransferase [Bradyrhizobium sp. 184]UPJ86731.1 class I SAM-dependent methyltransferase [Bradyrhizobium sp. 183]